METLIGVGAMLALWAFIRWDQRRIDASAPERSRTTSSSADGAAPGHRPASRFCAGLALVAASLALANGVSPPARPYSGRFSIVMDALYRAVGESGPAVFWMAVSAGLLALSALLRRRRP